MHLSTCWQKFRKPFQQNIILPWLVLFLFFSLLVTQNGGTNALSRLAALRAITESHTIWIDRYKDWTLDWAQAPSGHYYSNKAPGGALLGLPIFALLDLPILALTNSTKIDEKGRAPAPGYIELTLFTFIMQVIPYLWLVAFLAQKICARSSNLAAHVFAIAALMGNTAALYMNSYFGHGLAALLFLASTFLWNERRYCMAAFFIGLAVLCDYGTAFTLPAFLGFAIARERNIRVFIKIALGAFVPLMIYLLYHWLAFGNPLTTATAFTNSTQLYTLPGQSSSETLAHMPSLLVVQRLLFGAERGLLYTQPWVLLLLVSPLALFFSKHRWFSGFLVVSLVGLLWMNASFGGWNGGYCIGPRYLCLVFPAFAFLLGLIWKNISIWYKTSLVAGIFFSLAFRIFILPFSNLAPEENLWTYHWNLYATATSGTPWLRLGLGLTGFILCLVAVLRAPQNIKQLEL